MSTPDELSLFDQVVRIEHEADAVLARAQVKARELAGQCEQKVHALAGERDRAIEQTKKKLVAESEAALRQTLADLDAQAGQELEALERTRKERADELVEWAAAQIQNKLVPRSDGD